MKIRQEQFTATFFRAFGSVIVEITDLKYGLPSKHLFQQTEQHG